MKRAWCRRRSISGAAVLCLAGLVAPGVRAGTAYTVNVLTPNGFAAMANFANPDAKGGWNGTQFVGDLETVAGHQPQAIIWNVDGTVKTDLHPGGIVSGSFAVATNGTVQVGYGTGFGSSGTRQDALMWSGSAGTMVDLHPSAIPNGQSQATGVSLSGNTQVGYGYGFGAGANENHALVWTGSSGSVVDLQPLTGGFSQTFGMATTDAQQVGYGNGSASGYVNHALVWNGNAASMQDLHPTTASPSGSSQAMATDGTHQAGWVSGVGTNGNEQHAYVWAGTAASGVDLDPSGFNFSEAEGVRGNLVVGDGIGGTATGGARHAMVWDVVSSTYTDLGALLPAQFTASIAYSVDASGNVYGFADSPSGREAVEWVATAVPEPASGLLVLGAAGLATTVRRRSRRRASAL
jgi:hypothetical protein